MYWRPNSQATANYGALIGLQRRRTVWNLIPADVEPECHARGKVDTALPDDACQQWV
jgi:hypothetical protein